MTKKDSRPKWLTIGAAILLSAPVAFVFASIYSFNSRIGVAEEKLNTHDSSITEQGKELKEIHWYLIKRNNVKVPDEVSK